MQHAADAQSIAPSPAQPNTKTWDITLIALVAGGVVWGWLTWQQALINKDGVRYVASAEAIVQGDWHAAWHAFHWPFHPLVMAGVHLVTGLDIESAGYALNLVYYLITIAAFLAILRELGATRSVLCFGAALVLLHPDLNHTLPGIYRDQGFWGFFLLGMLCFLRLIRLGWWRYAVASSAALGVATLFRIEGLVIFALLPFAALIVRDRALPERLRRFAKAITVPLVLAVFGGILVGTGLLASEAVTETRFQEPIDRIERAWQAVSAELPAQAEHLADAVLNRHSDRHAFGALLAAYGYVLFASTLRGVNWLYLLLAALTLRRQHMRPAQHAQPTLIWLAAMYIAMLTAFMIQAQFVSHRYAAGLAFIVMIYASFALASLYATFLARYGRPLRKNWAWPLAMMLLVIVGLDGLIRTGAQNTQEREAGEWVCENIAHEADVYFDLIRSRYYADRPYAYAHDTPWEEVENMLEGDPWLNYDYIVIRIRRQSDERLDLATNLLKREPIRTFMNRRGSRVAIFAREERSQQSPSASTNTNVQD